MLREKEMIYCKSSAIAQYIKHLIVINCIVFFKQATLYFLNGKCVLI